MNRTITPFLMFQGRADEAIEFYLSLFPDSRIERMERYGSEGPGKEGTIKVAEIALQDMRVMVSESPAIHDFTFTPSQSLFVKCESLEEIQRLNHNLTRDGKALMPLDNYDFSSRFAWIEDRFGVSWQLNLE